MTDAYDPYEQMANISAVGETGRAGFDNQAQIAADTGGSKSYGVFGLNTWGKDPSATSAGQFAQRYGKDLGLTAPVGSAEFDAQWKAAAAQNPEALKAAQLDWYKTNIAGGVSQKLTAIGVPETVANDPRVQGYFADRMIQQGPASLQRHAQRIKGALADDPAAFLSNMSAADKSALGSDFRTYLGQHPDRVHGLANRVDKRQALSLGMTGDFRSKSSWAANAPPELLDQRKASTPMFAGVPRSALMSPANNAAMPYTNPNAAQPAASPGLPSFGWSPQGAQQSAGGGGGFDALASLQKEMAGLQQQAPPPMAPPPRRKQPLQVQPIQTLADLPGFSFLRGIS